MAWYNPFGRADVGDSQAQKNTPQAQAQAQPVASTSTSTFESDSASKSRLRSATTSPLSLSRDSQSQSTPPPQSTPSPVATSPELFQHAPPSPQYVSPTTFLTSLSPILPLSAFGIGFVSGLFSSAERASLVFLAENAHRKPTTVQGWYFYNKTKNYRVVWAAAKGAMKSGCRLGVWSSLFTVIEGASLFSRTVGFKQVSAADSHTDTRTIDEPPAEYTAAYRLGHWTDGMVAGQGVALAAIAVYRTSPFRFLGLGTIAGTLTGLLQDIRDELVWREKRKEVAEARQRGGAPEQATSTSAQ